MVDRAELLFSEVLNALCQIEKKRSGTGSFHSGMKSPGTKRRIAELEGMLQKEKAEFEVRPFLFMSNFPALLREFHVLEAVCQCIYVDNMKSMDMYADKSGTRWKWLIKLFFLDCVK